MKNTNFKVAIVADWMTNFAGGENVILKLHQMFPQAPIYTPVFNQKKLPQFKEARIVTSFLQRFPLSKTKHQFFLKPMIHAVESFDLSDFDVVISSAHSIAKGVITNPGTVHISYCHSPMRYAWDSCHEYIRNSSFPGFLRSMIEMMMTDIRMWDRLASERVDHFIANSNFIAQRIKKYYQRESKVIFPPVNIDKFRFGKRGKHFLALGRLIPYKKFDLLVEAFNENKLELKIVGDGPELKKLQKKAADNIKFLGRIDEQQVIKELATCRAFLFPQLEDFGISAVEAIASGKTLIAFRGGGALDIVLPENGLFFDEQNVSSLNQAIEKFLKLEEEFDPMKIRESAFRFDAEVFTREIEDFVGSKVA